MSGEMNKKYKEVKILHIDGDAFFANCERACDPTLSDKPIVVGKKRGIATAPCYKAKAQGIERGMMMSEVKEICPEAEIRSGNYSRYKLISQRMYDIFREMGDVVEEYSIDESFIGLISAGIVGSAKKIAKNIQKQVKTRLDIPVSVGIASNKTLAKIASDKNKPRGLCEITKDNKEKYLSDLDTSELWGVGKKLAARLNKLGIKTALEFTQADKDLINNSFNISLLKTYQELNGDQIIPLTRGSVAKHKSKSSSKTFRPPTEDKSKLFSHLSNNIEKACKRLRKFGYISDSVSVFIKRNDYENGGYTSYKKSIELPIASAHPSYILPRIKPHFSQIFKPNLEYRASGCCFSNLKKAKPTQLGMLDGFLEQQKKAKVYQAVDEIEQKFGDGTISLASSLRAKNKSEPENNVSIDKNKKLNIPSMGKVK